MFIQIIFILLRICDASADQYQVILRSDQETVEASGELGQIVPKADGYEVFQRTKCVAEFHPSDNSLSFEKLKLKYPKCWGVHPNPYMMIDNMKTSPPRGFSGGKLFRNGRGIIDQNGNGFQILGDGHASSTLFGSLKLDDGSVLEWCQAGDNLVCGTELKVYYGKSYFLRPKKGIAELMVKLRPYFLGDMNQKEATAIITASGFKSLLSIFNYVKSGNKTCQWSLIYEVNSQLVGKDSFEIQGGLVSCPHNERGRANFHPRFQMLIFN